MRWLLFLLLISQAALCQERKNHFNIVFGAGLSYFFNDASLNRRVDNTRSFGLNYILHAKKSAFCFNPGIQYQVNNYHARATAYSTVDVHQHALSVSTDVLLRLNKALQLRVGLVFNRVVDHFIEVTYTGNNSKGYYYYSNSEFYKNYDPKNFQAAANLGLSFLFKLFRREQKFNVKYIQYANGLVNSDFWMSKSVVGEDTKVLSSKARPSMLVFSLEISLQRLKKRNKEKETSD